MRKIAIDIGNTFLGEGAFLTEEAHVGKLVSNVLTAALSLAGIILIVYFIIGGIGIMAGAGNDNPEQAAKGKKAATSAAIGFVVVFAAYWIVQLIEVITGLNLI